MGDPVCWLHLVCEACGRLVEADEGPACPRCGARPAEPVQDRPERVR